MRKGIILFLLLVFGICFETYATVINPAPFIAASAAANASAAASRRRMHENKYHNGPIAYYTEETTLYSKHNDTLYKNNKYIKRNNILYVDTYLIKNYYYKMDPDKCVISTEKSLINSREATEDEIKNRRFYAEILIGTLLIIIAITIAIIILVKIFNKDDEYELLEGCENITYLDH